MLSKLGRNLEPDTRPASGQQSYFAFEYVGLERRLHFFGYMVDFLPLGMTDIDDDDTKKTKAN